MGPVPMQYSYTRPTARRPMDKKIITIAQTATSAGQDSTNLATATFPGTVVGLRWDFDVRFETNGGIVAWAIVVVREGASADTLALADGASLYQPEQNVLAGGLLVMGTDGTYVQKVSGSTKAMRKLQGGDQLLFISLGSDAPSAGIYGTVQYFIKT